MNKGREIKTAIIIPVYKEILEKFEEASFKQCLHILFKYDIYIITHKSLNIEAYIQISKEYNIHLNISLFDEQYFQGVKGYNCLMLNIDFYRRFQSYYYMLIYQLDAYVFRDELAYWCSQSYDYIGAPWFENYSSYEEGAALWSVGNGGFSLRKISYFIKVLTWNYPVKKISLKYLCDKYFVRKLFFMLGRCNNIRYFLINCNWNEDAFYTQFLKDSWIVPYVPDVKMASYFAFEKSPTYLFDQCQHKLPFGCHAFQKYEYDKFWKNFIVY